MRKTVLVSLVILSGLAVASASACSASSSSSGGGGGQEGGASSSGGQEGGASSSGGQEGGASSSGGEGGASSSGGEGGASSSGGEGGASSSGGDGGSSSGGAHGWTALTLPQETYDAGTVDHATYDWVTDIRMTSTTAGLVSTFTFANPDSSQGGAIFAVNGTTLTVVASGTLLQDSAGNGGGFMGLYGSGQTILSPMDNVERFVQSTNGGGAFALAQGGNGFYNNGLQPSLGFYADGSGHWWAADNFNVYSAPSAPAAATTWTIVTPAAATCDPPGTYNGDPSSGGQTERGGMNLHVSSDGKLLVYPQSPAGGVAVCVSTNGAQTWTKVTMPNPPASPPDTRNVYFMDDTHGIFFGGDAITGDTAFVYYTADGSNWTAATIPPQAATDVVGLFSAFFAPDHTTGWMLGKKSGDDAAPPLLFWKTTDGGKTWTDITTTSFTGTSIDPTGFSPMVVGFALDANNIWIGGHDGGLFYNNNGGN